LIKPTDIALTALSIHISRRCHG